MHKCLRNSEPVLLVGETGCGKTSLCQVFAALRQQELFSINCHQNTETSDFIGCMRTRKNLQQSQENLEKAVQEISTQLNIPLTNGLKKNADKLLSELKKLGKS